MRIFWNEYIKFFPHFFFSSCSIPDEESIFTFDDSICWIIDAFPIQKIVYIFPIFWSIYFPEIICEISASHSPQEVRKEVSPSRGCHMDMNEVSLVIMEVYSVLRCYSFSDIASAHFFHVDIFAKIPLFSIDIARKICMPVNLVRSWSEYIGETDSENENTEESENLEYFFHKKECYSIACIITSIQPIVAHIVRMRRFSYK